MREKILLYLEKIPALSPTITKIVELSGKQSTSASDLVRVIKLDPVLTAKILRLINSSYFGMPNQISSINTAIVLLGFNTIKNLALSAEVLSSFNPGTGSDFDVEKFWEHSLACAVACKLLAEKIVKEPQKREEYFIAGLIHDIGKIFLIKYFATDYFSSVCDAIDSNDLLKKEKGAFEMEHAEIGGLISEKWGLPKNLVLAIQTHHTCLDKEEDSIISAIVYISNMYCKSKGFDDSIEASASIPAPDNNDWKRLDLEKAKAEEVLSVLETKVEEAKVFLKIGNK